MAKKSKRSGNGFCITDTYGETNYYDYIGRECCGLRVVRKDHKNGYMYQETYIQACPLKYDWASEFNPEGLAVIREGTCYSVINRAFQKIFTGFSDANVILGKVRVAKGQRLGEIQMNRQGVWEINRY